MLPVVCCTVVVTFSSGSEDDEEDNVDEGEEEYRDLDNSSSRQSHQRLSVDSSVSTKAGKCTYIG